MMARSIHILMEGAPADVDSEALVAELESIAGVIEVHHVHIWELDEHHRALEAHVVVDDEHLARWTEIKQEIKLRLGERFHIHHSTLEFEAPGEEACQPCPPAGRASLLVGSVADQRLADSSSVSSLGEVRPGACFKSAG